MRLGQSLSQQNVLPLTETAIADQGLAYLEYQEGLLFTFGTQVFNALTVISLASMMGPGIAYTGDFLFVPNVNQRPKRVSNTEWGNLFNTAAEVYRQACLKYEAREQEVRANAEALCARRSRPEDYDRE
jgi:hypothetical protein